MYTEKEVKKTIEEDGLGEAIWDITPAEIENEELSIIWNNLFIYFNELLDFFEKNGIM